MKYLNAIESGGEFSGNSVYVGEGGYFHAARTGSDAGLVDFDHIYDTVAAAQAAAVEPDMDDSEEFYSNFYA